MTGAVHCLNVLNHVMATWWLGMKELRNPQPVAAPGSARSDEKFDVHFLMKLIARGKFVDGPSSKWSSSFFKYLLKNERM